MQTRVCTFLRMRYDSVDRRAWMRTTQTMPAGQLGDRGVRYIAVLKSDRL